MDQKELRAWEYQCIQEESPRCKAACPLHVDVKEFCALMGNGRWDKAWQTLAKIMPLPGVLARLCDGPCRDTCVRADAGGAILMDSLERFCAEVAKPVAPPRPLPSRKKSVAVVGGGLTGLCGAWEMARRGFDVTLFCTVPGGPSAILADLPQGVLERELESLTKLRVKVEDGVEYSGPWLDTLLEESDAVFLDRDDFPESLQDFGDSDELTLGTQRPGLFAGVMGRSSAILQAADGRRAANSIGRFTQGVSMVTGRELEGPYESRLFTSLAKVESVPPVSKTGNLDEASAKEEASRCIQCECMECVKACEYLKHFKYYPKTYVRQIYNNESIVMGTRQANKMINSCMLCGLCKTVCPEDFDMGEVCLQARRTLVEQGHMPPSAHDFALRDMAFANGERCVIAAHAPGASSSEYVFFPGCQLTASDPDGVERAYADLRARVGDVGLLLHCCGAPAHWSGREDLVTETTTSIAQKWESLGRPKIIASCPSCLESLRRQIPQAEVASHWSVLRALGLPKGSGSSESPLAINTPCAARHDTIMQEDIRVLLDWLGVDAVEPEMTGETTECCGYGGLLAEANPPLAKKVAQRRAAAADEDFVTYCVMCRDQMARVNKRAVHIYDLLYPGGADPAGRPSPGYSDRRENRIRLRERLLKDLWNDEETVRQAAHEAVTVAFTDDARNIMEERRILKSDVQKVLLHVQESGRWFISRESGLRLASFRPAIVTYWVAFEERDGEFLVHNAWSHRMRIKGGQP